MARMHREELTSGNLADRVAELDSLVTFLQADSERKCSSVASKLHDDLGGSVIGAMMDVAWIEQHDSQLSTDTVTRLGKVKEGLRCAIDLARGVVEELRPTLLDSMGLFAALSWQLGRGCARAGIAYSETYPETAPEMDPNKLIALFRIAQESFDLALLHDSVSAVNLTVDTQDGGLTLHLRDDGKRSAADEDRSRTSAAALSIMHRVKQLRGEAAITSPVEGGSGFRVSVPLP